MNGKLAPDNRLGMVFKTLVAEADEAKYST